MRRFIGWAAALLLAVALGAGSALFIIQRGARTLGAETIQGWTFSRLAGSSAADPYTRALVAKAGLLALAQTETIYFSLNHDDQGAPLREACTYEISGAAPPARWWSVTIYAADDFLPQNPLGGFSIDATRTPISADGRWVARIAPAPALTPDALSSLEAGDSYSLTLRLYNPADSAREDPAALTLPRLRKIACEDAS